MLIIELIIICFNFLKKFSREFLSILEKRSLLFLCIFTIFGAYIRIFSNLNYSWGTDDYDHISYVTDKFFIQTIIDSYRDAHPPLRNMLLYLLRLVSHDQLTTRVVALLPGILLIPAVYFLTLRLFTSKLAGLFTSFIIAFSKIYVTLSHGTRPYMLACLLIAVHIYISFQFFKSFNKKYLLLYAFNGFLIVSNDYGSISIVLTVAAVGALTLFYKNKIKLLTEWLAIVFIQVAFFLYEISLVYKMSGYRTEKAHVNDISLTLSEICTKGINIFSENFFATYNSQISLFTMFLIGVYLLFKEKKYDVLAYGLMPLVLTIIMAQLSLYPFMSGRQTIVVSFCQMFIVSYVVVYLERIKDNIGKPIIVLVISLLAISYNYNITIFNPEKTLSGTNLVSTGHNFNDYNTILKHLKSKIQKGDYLFINKHRVKRTKDNLPYEIAALSIYELFPHLYCDLVNVDDKKLINCIKNAFKKLGNKAYDKRFVVPFTRRKLSDFNKAILNEIDIVEIYRPNPKRISYIGIFKLKNKNHRYQTSIFSRH